MKLLSANMGSPEVLQIRERSPPSGAEVLEVKGSRRQPAGYLQRQVCIPCLRASPPCPASR